MNKHPIVNVIKGEPAAPPVIDIHQSELVDIPTFEKMEKQGQTHLFDSHGDSLIEYRAEDLTLGGHAFFLSNCVRWVIGTDASSGAILLIPLKKK